MMRLCSDLCARDVRHVTHDPYEICRMCMCMSTVVEQRKGPFFAGSGGSGVGDGAGGHRQKQKLIVDKSNNEEHNTNELLSRFVHCGVRERPCPPQLPLAHAVAL